MENPNCGRRMNMSKRKTLIGVIWIGIETFLIIGVHYGWPNMVVILKADGIFDCSTNSLANANANANANLIGVNSTNYAQLIDFTSDFNRTKANESTATIGRKPTCKEQDEKYAIAFQICSAATVFINVPMGVVFDRYGARFIKFVGLATFIAGSLMLGFVTPATDFLVYIGLTCFGISAALLYTANLQIAELFHSRKYFVITAQVGAFISSGMIFLFVKLAVDGGVSRVVCLVVLACIGLVSCTATAFLFLPRFKFDPTCPGRELPRPTRSRPPTQKSTPNPNPNPTPTSTPTQTPDASASPSVAASTADLVPRPEPPKAPAATPSLWKSMLERNFVTNLIWFSLIWLVMLNYIGSIGTVINRSFDATVPDSVKRRNMNEMLDVLAVLTVSGIFFTPIGGILTDFTRKRAPKIIAYLSSHFSASDAGVSSGVVDAKFNNLIAILPSILLGSLAAFLLSVSVFFGGAALYLSFVLINFCRALVMGTTISFCFLTFPRAIFGKMFGLTFCSAGVFTVIGAFVQAALLRATDKYDVGGWDGYTTLRIFYLILAILSFLHPAQIFISLIRSLRRRSTTNSS